jgi:hypothetical protein
MSSEIIIHEPAAETPEAHSAQVAAEAAQAAIAASAAASALANVAAAESIAENNGAVSEVIEAVEQNERGLEWVSEQVEVCLQNQVNQAEMMEALTIQLSELLATVARIPLSIYSTPEPEPLTLSEENTPLLEQGTIPETEVITEAPPSDAAALPAVVLINPPVPVKRKHRPL